MFTFALVERLLERGHDVTLFAAGDSEVALPLEPIVARATVPDSQRRFNRCNHRWIESVEDGAYCSLMKQLANSDFDAIHNNTINPIPLRFADRLPLPLVTTLHVPVLPRLRREIELRGAAACGSFVNISQTNAAQWSALLPHQQIVHNGVDTRFWNACASDKLHRAIWFGRILPDKGTHLAVEAAHQAGLAIDVVGPIADQQYFAAKVQPALRPNDNYLGHRSHHDLCELIGQAAVSLVTPCWDEPFGLVVAESLACGTPVAAFARGAMTELITRDAGRLATPGDTRGLAAAARACLPLSADGCRRLARRKFSLERMVDDYERLYASQLVETAA